MNDHYVSYAIPIIRIVDRVREFRVRRLQHEAELAAAKLKREPFDVQSPRFNKYPWCWRRRV